MKSSPIAMINTAETFSSNSRRSLSTWPRPVALTPSTMKIAEKLPTKSRLGTRTRLAGASSSSST